MFIIETQRFTKYYMPVKYFIKISFQRRCIFFIACFGTFSVNFHSKYLIVKYFMYLCNVRNALKRHFTAL